MKQRWHDWPKEKPKKEDIYMCRCVLMDNGKVVSEGWDERRWDAELGVFVRKGVPILKNYRIVQWKEIEGEDRAGEV